MEEFRRAYARLCAAGGAAPQEAVLRRLRELGEAPGRGRLDLAAQSLSLETCGALGRLLPGAAPFAEVALGDCGLSEEGGRGAPAVPPSPRGSRPAACGGAGPGGRSRVRPVRAAAALPALLRPPRSRGVPPARELHRSPRAVGGPPAVEEELWTWTRLPAGSTAGEERIIPSKWICPACDWAVR